MSKPDREIDYFRHDSSAARTRLKPLGDRDACQLCGEEGAELIVHTKYKRSFGVTAAVCIECVSCLAHAGMSGESVCRVLDSDPLNESLGNWSKG